MITKNNILKERLDILVTAANITLKGEVEVDKNVLYIIGILFSSDREDIAYHRGSQRIMINDIEHFPEKYESRLLMMGQNVQVNERMYRFEERDDRGNILSIGVEPGNRKVEMTYTDKDHPLAVFQPYTVTLYVYSKVKK